MKLRLLFGFILVIVVILIAIIVLLNIKADHYQEQIQVLQQKQIIFKNHQKHLQLLKKDWRRIHDLYANQQQTLRAFNDVDHFKKALKLLAEEQNVTVQYLAHQIQNKQLQVDFEYQSSSQLYSFLAIVLNHWPALTITAIDNKQFTLAVER